jgi:hypothetical protein
LLRLSLSYKKIGLIKKGVLVMKRILVCGGGFIGGAMALRLKGEGNFVRIADIKNHEFIDMQSVVGVKLIF